MLIFKAFLIGLGKIIPGVSGSIIAISFGLYEKIIDAISNYFKDIKKNTIFLFKIMLGVSLAIFIGAKILYYFINNYPNITLMMITGLIIGNVPSLFKKAKYSKKNIFLTIIPILLIIAFNVFFKFEVKNNANNFTIILLGILESATTIIPGISGTAVLINLGYYNYNLQMISSLNINYLFFYVIGVIIGLILLVKLIEFILKNYSIVFYLVINGLVIASIYSIFTSFTFTSFNEFVMGLSLLILGIFISYLSTYKL